MRCALVEFNAYHDEVLPTFVWLLNRLDVTPDVYLVERAARRRPFAGYEGLRYRARSVEGIHRRRGIAFRLRRHDLAIVNSLEPPKRLQRAARLGLPILGVVHNTHLLVDDPAYRSFFTVPGRRPLVLGQHIAERVAGPIGAPWWISHVVFPAQRRASHLPGRHTVFAVSGNVEFRRRNYDALLDAAAVLAAEHAPFRVRIVGRSTYPDGRAFRAAVEARGLADKFEFSPGEIDNPEFTRRVAESDFSLPLLDTTRDAFRPYFETKLTASVPLAIGLGVPLVANAAVVRAYRIEGTGPAYDDGGLAQAMRHAIASTSEERTRWRVALERKRERILESSLVNLGAAIHAVRSETL
jgi:hypothetical protein